MAGFLSLLLNFKGNPPGFRHNVFISGRIKLCNSLFSDYASAESTRFASQVYLHFNTCCASFQDQQWDIVTKSLLRLLIQMQQWGGSVKTIEQRDFHLLMVTEPGWVLLESSVGSSLSSVINNIFLMITFLMCFIL